MTPPVRRRVGRIFYTWHVGLSRSDTSLVDPSARTRLEEGRHLGDHRVCGLGFIYFAYSWAASGRTAGMALFGVQVVRDDGTGASPRRAAVRTLAPCRRPMRRPGL
jgi:hypothetical protein